MSQKKDISGLKPFVPGQSGNPSGRPKLPTDLKNAKKMDRIEIDRTLSSYLRKTKDELSEIARDPKATALQLFVLSIITKGITEGDQSRLNFLFDRIIGKVKEEIDVSVYPKPIIIKRMDGSEVVLTSQDQVIEDDGKE